MMGPSTRFSVVHITLFYISGILIENFLEAPVFLYVGSFFILLILGIWRMTRYVVSGKNPYLIITIALLGALNLAIRNSPPSPLHVVHLAEKGYVTLIGKVCREPERSEGRTYLVVDAEKVEYEGVLKGVRGRVRVTFAPLEDSGKEGETSGDVQGVNYGDRIRVYCKLRLPKGSRNPGGVDYRAFLRRQGILVVTYIDKVGQIERVGRSMGNSLISLAIAIKGGLCRVIERTTVAPYDGLLTGLLLGDDSAIPDEIKEDFKKSGVYHILAVSGLHVGIVAILFLVILQRSGLTEKVAIPFVLFFLLLYAAATGWRWSVMRAAIMVGISLVGRMAKRENNSRTAIALAAFIILLISPLALFDVGFQLSFVATLSIMELDPVMLRLIPSLKKGSRGALLWDRFRAAIAISLAAQIGTAPLLAYYFNQISLISPFANLLISPLVALVIQLGFIAGFAGQLIPLLGMAINAINEVILYLILKLARTFSLIPFSWLYVGTPSYLFLLIYYILLLWICAGASYPVIFGGESILPRRAMIALCVIITLLVGGEALQVLSPILTITFIDVGQGDSIFIEVPGGSTILVDGGGKDRSQGNGFDVGEGIVVPFLRSQGVRRIDLLLLTHPHEDHVGGLCAVLEHFPVGQVIEYAGPYDGGEERLPYSYNRFREIITEKGVMRTMVRRGMTIFVGERCRLEVLHPGKTPIKDSRAHFNDNSLVIRLKYGDTCFLLTGDIEKGGEEALLRSGMDLSSHLLKVAHHGGDTSTSTRFLRYVRPKYGIISVGPNPFGHPSETTLKRLQEENVEIYRTDLSGAVIVRSDGRGIKVKRWEE